MKPEGILKYPRTPEVLYTVHKLGDFNKVFNALNDHQDIYLIKNTVKTVILWNIIKIQNLKL